MRMAMIYATLIIKGTKAYREIPAVLKNQVKTILIDCGCENLITE